MVLFGLTSRTLLGTPPYSPSPGLLFYSLTTSFKRVLTESTQVSGMSRLSRNKGLYRIAVLHATYYASSDQHPPAKKSDLIVPLSTLLNNTGNDASVPPGFSVRLANNNSQSSVQFHLRSTSHFLKIRLRFMLNCMRPGTGTRNFG
jgi:hypothetical protein